MKRIYLKKAVGLCMGMLLLLTFFCLQVSAAEGIVEAPKTISLEEDQTEVTLKLSVTTDESYAGLEFGLECPAGVSVKSVTYDVENAYTASPTEARGFTWFSFFAGDNIFSGKATATIVLNCNTTGTATVTLRHLNLMTKANAKVETSRLDPNTEIVLQRNGSVTKPQEDPSDTTDNAGNTNNNDNQESAENQNKFPENASGSNTSNNETTVTSPETGDSATIVPALVGVIVSAATLLVLTGAFVNKKKSRKD